MPAFSHERLKRRSATSKGSFSFNLTIGMEKNTYLIKNLTGSHPFETAVPTGGNFRGANGIAQYTQLQRKAQKKW